MDKCGGGGEGEKISPSGVGEEEEGTVAPATTATTRDRDNNKEVAAISWTGGKDCNLALLHAARDPGLDVRFLVAFRFLESSTRRHWGAHPGPLMEAQADSLGLELVRVDVPPCGDTAGYLRAYVDGIRKLRDERGVTVVVTGDMELVGTASENWIARCCKEAGEGMRAYLPLWNRDRRECLDAILEEGIEAVFSCVKSPFFDGSWIGRRLDADSLREMEEIADRTLTEEQIGRGVQPLDLCGERGEYHTMCVDGPLYRKRIDLAMSSKPVQEDANTDWKGNIHNAESIWIISLQ